jgi:hypothetical protein
MAKLDEQIALAAERLKQLKLRQLRSDSRRRALESKRAHKVETRRRFLVGTVVMERARDGRLDPAVLRDWLDGSLTRPEDRALFDLPPREGPAAPSASCLDVARGTSSGETKPAPGIEGDDGHGVGEIDASARGFHRNEQGVRGADPLENDCG